MHSGVRASAQRVASPHREHGFVVELPAGDVHRALAELALLEAGGWLDAQTRALFVEFSLYLPPSDLLLAARLVVEVHPTGTVWTDMSLEPVDLTVYTLENRGLLAVEIAGLLIAFFAIFWELWHIRSMRLHHGVRSGAVRASRASRCQLSSHFMTLVSSCLRVLLCCIKSAKAPLHQFELRSAGKQLAAQRRVLSVQAILWTTVGLLLYTGIICAVALHTVNVRKAEELAYTKGEYLASHKLGYMVSVERGLWAVCSFAIWFRLLKCARLIRRVVQLLRRSAHCPASCTRWGRLQGGKAHFMPGTPHYANDARLCGGPPRGTTLVQMRAQVHIAAAEARHPRPHDRPRRAADCGLLPHLLRHLPRVCAVLLHGILRERAGLPDVPAEHHERAPLHGA
jgi:Polycystin cation channel